MCLYYESAPRNFTSNLFPMGFIFGCLLATIDVWLLWVISVTWWMPRENPWSSSLLRLAVVVSIGTLTLVVWRITRTRLLGRKCLPKIIRAIFCLPYIPIIVCSIPLFEVSTHHREKEKFLHAYIASGTYGHTPGWGPTFSWMQAGMITRPKIVEKSLLDDPSWLRQVGLRSLSCRRLPVYTPREVHRPRRF